MFALLNLVHSFNYINVLVGFRTETEAGAAHVTRKGGTPRKSFSFTHSTPRRELAENLIKITKMGTVSVPVPYPITPLNGSQAWF
jgi:hypothetical protein